MGLGIVGEDGEEGGVLFFWGVGGFFSICVVLCEDDGEGMLLNK